MQSVQRLHSTNKDAQQQQNVIIKVKGQNPVCLVVVTQ